VAAMRDVDDDDGWTPAAVEYGRRKGGVWVCDVVVQLGSDYPSICRVDIVCTERDL